MVIERQETTSTVASYLPTLILPVLSLYISKVWSSGGVHFPSLSGRVGSLWLTLEYCDFGIIDATVGLTCLGHGLSGCRGGDGALG